MFYLWCWDKTFYCVHSILWDGVIS